MKIECLTFFIYGMCVMFYSMMVWMFWRKGNDKLSRLIMLLMVVLDLECLKDLALYLSDFELHKSMWHWVNATDMVVVPVYTFVLMELVKPGWLSWRKAALHEESTEKTSQISSLTTRIAGPRHHCVATPLLLGIFGNT